MIREGRLLTIDEKIDILDFITQIDDGYYFKTYETRRGYLTTRLSCGLCTIVHALIGDYRIGFENVNYCLEETFNELAEFRPSINKKVCDEYFNGKPPIYWFDDDERVLFVLCLRELLLTIKQTQNENEN